MKRNGLAAKFTKGALIGAWLMGVGLVNLWCDDEKSLHWDGYYKSGSGSMPGNQLSAEQYREISSIIANGADIYSSIEKYEEVWNEATDTFYSWAQRKLTQSEIDNYFTKMRIIRAGHTDGFDLKKAEDGSCVKEAKLFNAACDYTLGRRSIEPVMRDYPTVDVSVAVSSSQEFDNGCPPDGRFGGISIGTEWQK